MLENDHIEWWFKLKKSSVICYSSYILKHSRCLKKSLYLGTGQSEQVKEKSVTEWERIKNGYSSVMKYQFIQF